MSQPAEDFVRREAGTLLRVDYRGKFLCSLCLGKSLYEIRGTTYTRGQIERALLAVFKAPRALKYMNPFVCDECGMTKPCLGVPTARA